MQTTRCPQCETAFKVSPPQLEAAKGWVRCGRCAHVFEAHLYMNEAPAPLPVDASAPELFRTAVQQAEHETSDVGVGHTDIDNLHSVSSTEGLSRSWPWVVTAACLSLMLLIQLLIWHRNTLAAEEPALRPVLSVLCGGCAVSWPREPDAVLIEGSSFTENPQGGYNVQLRLKNTQHHAVAMPALELSLTDLRDQVLVRRVFSAEELAARDHLQALRDARVNLHFDLEPSISSRIAGFRALVFYP